MSGSIILGIDLGTSGVKAMLLDSDAGVLAVQHTEYGVSIPEEGAGEQEPEMWWEALKGTLNQVKSKEPEAFSKIKAIGFSGQMHGLVMVDKNGAPVRPAILWLDQRSEEVAKKISEQIGFERMGEVFHNRVYPGFAFPSLMWVKEREPSNYEKTAAIMMPKDYIRYKITGNIGTDASDASSACVSDEKKRDWAWDIIEEVGLNKDIFPEVHEATEIAGYVTKACSEETGIPEGATVVFGCGDQPAQGTGNGQIKEGDAISNIGTGGQISAFFGKDIYDPGLRLQAFCHGIKKSYTVFGATLAAGMSLKWLKNNILELESYDKATELAAQIAPGSDGLTYLPYLSGERAPLMDPRAKGMFWGLKLAHDRRHMVRAVMEGITFSLKDSLEIFKDLNLPVERIIASGGGAVSPMWLQMQADIFEKPVYKAKVSEQACLGAAMIAGVGSGIFKDIEEACEKHVGFEDKIYTPNPDMIPKYRAAYERYKKVRDANLEVMDEF